MAFLYCLIDQSFKQFSFFASTVLGHLMIERLKQFKETRSCSLPKAKICKLGNPHGFCDIELEGKAAFGIYYTLFLYN